MELQEARVGPHWMSEVMRAIGCFEFAATLKDGVFSDRTQRIGIASYGNE